LESIYFEYDSSDLSEAARLILATNADYVKKYKDIEILVEGHTDERGTIAYNLALGQKRAHSVRTYYVALGIEPKKIGTLSYGEEKSVCAELTEECWSQNRRVESKIRTLKVVDNGKKPKTETTEK
jgi:peptidoglycan-associated lipoprotein